MQVILIIGGVLFLLAFIGGLCRAASDADDWSELKIKEMRDKK